MTTGKVWLVGAGPSDPGLMTIRGREVLKTAQVVVYDRLVSSGVLAMVPPAAKLIDVGKQAGNHPVEQDEINEILLREAKAGKRVVRLKGGDPFLFGRGGEELELLEQNHIPYEIVPGIPSAIAVPAYAGIPVTHRDYASSVHIITGHLANGRSRPLDYAALARLSGTLVFLMGLGNLEEICEGLLKAGISPHTPAAVIQKGTSARQKTVISTLVGLPAEARSKEITSPAIIVIGKVCSLARRFSWREKLPLFGVKIVVTRPQNQLSTLSRRLAAKGAEVIQLPAIRTSELIENVKLDEALQNLALYHYLVFTSPSGVSIFFDRLIRKRMDIRMLAGLKIAVIGGATAKAVRSRGLTVDLCPEIFSAGNLGRLLAERANGKILIVRAKEGSPELTKELEKACLPYDDVPLYETLPEVSVSVEMREEAKDADYFAFTSASTVQSTVDRLPGFDFSGVKALCIGEQTAERAKAYGMQVFIASKASMDSMTQLVIQLEQQRKWEEKENGDAHKAEKASR